MRTDWILTGRSGNGQVLYAISDEHGCKFSPNSLSRATRMTHKEALRLKDVYVASYKGCRDFKVTICPHI